MTWITALDFILMFTLGLLIFNKLSWKQAAHLVAYLVIRIGILLLLVTINKDSLDQTAAQIGWFSTIILGFTCLYLGWFSIVSIPVVFFRWVTGQSPRYIRPPQEKNPPPEP